MAQSVLPSSHLRIPEMLLIKLMSHHQRTGGIKGDQDSQECLHEKMGQNLLWIKCESSSGEKIWLWIIAEYVQETQLDAQNDSN